MNNKWDNCITTLKLLACLQVFAGHLIPSFGIRISESTSFIISIFEGVPIFLALSGFLIWGSIGRSTSFADFGKKRVYRLYPELWGGVLLNAVIMVVLYHEEIKWIPFLLFQLTQGTVVQFWTPSSLRGYGTGTPNGPLWTISVIVQCYVVLWFLYKVLHQKSVKRWAAIILFFITFNVFRAEVLTSIKPAMAAKVVWYSFPTHLWLFLVGALLREYIDEWKCILAKMWWVFFLAAICVNYFKFDFGSYGVLKGTFLALSAVGFAYAYPQLSIANDYSYGIYLYHMIVINLLVEVGITEGCLPVVLSFTGTIILSVVSYHTLGQLKQHTGKPNKELST